MTKQLKNILFIIALILLIIGWINLILSQGDNYPLSGVCFITEILIIIVLSITQTK